MLQPRRTAAQILREKAQECRSAARQNTDHPIAAKLLELAARFERQAEQDEGARLRPARK